MMVLSLFQPFYLFFTHYYLCKFQEVNTLLVTNYGELETVLNEILEGKIQSLYLIDKFLMKIELFL